ncbi:hypothetical protein AMTRI_Chr03g48090 [Amborella trichopoda]
MDEITVVEEDGGRSNGDSSSSRSSGARTVGDVPEPFDSEALPPTIIEIRPFLRVANEIEHDYPRVAYLCRVHALERAHIMDPHSTGRKVRQFKTLLLQRLERDEKATESKRKANSERRELHKCYEDYSKYTQAKSANRELFTKANEITSVLLEVWTAITSGAPEVLSAGKDVKGKAGLYVPYNILPLDPGGAEQAIMQLLEIKAAVAALHNIRGLHWPKDADERENCRDLLDWLQFTFGFQKGNVANQREHLILLLANIHIRLNPKPKLLSKLDDRALNELMNKLFKNYLTWCKFLGRKNNLWLPTIHIEELQYKILYMGLYLLIWGEAANLRLIPECLCYMFHHMAYELQGVLSGTISLLTGEKVVPASVHGGGPEAFLDNIVTPIYRVIYEEAQKSKNGTARHSQWRNYDDLNEFFWSPDCFQLGWPMRTETNFFFVSGPTGCDVTRKKWALKKDKLLKEEACHCEEALEEVGVPAELEMDKSLTEAHYQEGLKEVGVQGKIKTSMKGDYKSCWIGKTNFVEIRSFMHLFRSFYRMWTFFILALQLIIQFFHFYSNFVAVSFIYLKVWGVLAAVLDVIFTWKARKNMKFSLRLRYFLKIATAAIWVIIFSVYYAHPNKNSTCIAKLHGSWVSIWRCPSSYTSAVAIYLLVNAIRMVLFFFPAMSSYIETSNWRALTLLTWWGQPRLYVGRGLQESMFSVVKYTFFWMLLLISKLLFSYYFEIKPLMEPTKQIMEMSVSKYDWHEFFPKVKNNAGAILAIWAPVILVYFMDTQIWYAFFCTIFGGICGAFRHLGEIRTMGALRTRFQSLPGAFNACLMPTTSNKDHKKNVGCFFLKCSPKVSGCSENDGAKFALVWNQIISSLRSEDLISNMEMDLLNVPYSLELSSNLAHWPLFLIAPKFQAVVDLAKNFIGKDKELYRKIRKDAYMFCAVKESFESLKCILDILVVGKRERSIVYYIIHEVEASINRSCLLSDFKISELPLLCSTVVQLVDFLFENKESSRDTVIKLLQDVVEIVARDMMVNGPSIGDSFSSSESELMHEVPTMLNGVIEAPLFLSMDPPAICFPLPAVGSLKKQVKRLRLLLSVNESAMDVPSNLEARRRLSFFATSLFMDMPTAPKVRNMLSFSVMTPYLMEEVMFSEDELHSAQDGVSIASYMQKIYPDEWKNFLERIECENGEDIKENNKQKELCEWATFRGQTLSRTVRGMMYYRKALKLQAFLDMPKDEGWEEVRSQRPLSAQLKAITDMKFTYVVSCQMFGAHKSSGDRHAQDIVNLMIKYPSLRVAYIEEKEQIGNGKAHKVYSSILVKAVNNLDKEIYRIKLPGPPNIGEGKPENQNHAIIFTRGEALQTIDMNQDNYLEEALKMRNVLQEFLKHHGKRHPTILGLREHIFTGSFSSLAGFMSHQETSFVTIGQRLLADPLKVRFHYGHPDIFDRLFHITRGGISKASKVINLSEDIFAGFNSTLRQGNVTYHEYIQVGKGRDVGLNLITKFEAKVANGNGEQTLSRDLYRLGHHFDFFRMLSCYFTTIGFYSNSLIMVLAVYAFLYGQLYLVLSGLEKAILEKVGRKHIESLESALASQSFIQFGLLTGLPMVMEIALERGFRAALSKFITMQLKLSSVFFTFSLGTKTHYYGRTLLHGGAKYRATGRRFTVFHVSFAENYRLYSRSHFVKGFELIILLIIYNMYGQSLKRSFICMVVTYSIWFTVVTWLFAPFLFNPSGFKGQEIVEDWKAEGQKIVEDWKGWKKWIKNSGGIGVQQEKSWESWWDAEQSHLKYSGLSGKIIEIILSLRFFVYQYGLVYHLDITHEEKSILVYTLSWIVIATLLIAIKAVNKGRQFLGAQFHFEYRLLKVCLFLGASSILLVLFSVYGLSLMDVFVCCLAFLPTGWGLLMIAQAVRPLIEDTRLWESVQVLAQAYDYGMGFILFIPVAILALIRDVSDLQKITSLRAGRRMQSTNTTRPRRRR